MSNKPQVFLSYAHEDREVVLDLYTKLLDSGYQPWMDIKNLLPGQRWTDEIRKALSSSDFVLIFLSRNSISKEGYINKEIKSALEIARNKVSGSIVLIPVKIDDVQVPSILENIQWVELYADDGWKKLLWGLSGRDKIVAEESLEQLEDAVQEIKKPQKHIFVAMPFSQELEDYFFYGIRVPIQLANFNYLRIDKDSFTGEILHQIRNGIETAEAVVAVLDKANPNVYLEVGYAWGKEIPTILLIRDVNELRFDVSGHRCLIYSSIRNLEEILSSELLNLRQKGIISS